MRILQELALCGDEVLFDMHMLAAIEPLSPSIDACPQDVEILEHMAGIHTQPMLRRQGLV